MTTNMLTPELPHRMVSRFSVQIRKTGKKDEMKKIIMSGMIMVTTIVSLGGCFSGYHEHGGDGYYDRDGIYDYDGIYGFGNDEI